MIVIGADPHKKTHTLVAVDAASGEQLGCETIDAARVGSEQQLAELSRTLSQRTYYAV